MRGGSPARTGRIFVAIPLPAGLKKSLLDLAPAEGRPERDPHLTLRFIGPLASESLEPLGQALAEVQGRKFSLQAVGLGLFPRGPLWAGLASAPELLALKKQVDLAIEKTLGLPAETRPFQPHLTIARFQRPPGPDLRKFCQERSQLVLGSFEVQGFGLYQSHLTPSGAKRELLALINF
ncbi:MAG: RNA 2',3'-cyclic phosphodiesterase [Deltaproteobacteria bacterium]|nr:RNA 2',3'-cyclic phosphodiesterase [Deltaproteobacteria bacterium]